jgi:hypothetical protein
MIGKRFCGGLDFDDTDYSREPVAGVHLRVVRCDRHATKCGENLFCNSTPFAPPAGQSAV